MQAGAGKLQGGQLDQRRVPIQSLLPPQLQHDAGKRHIRRDAAEA